MMNVLSDVLCDTSPLMAPQSFSGTLPQNKILSHNMSSNQAPLILEPVSQISNLSSVTHSSPSDNIFNSTDQIHIPSNIDSGFEDRSSSISVFSNSFPEIVSSWHAHDFMKVSDNLASPNVLSNVSNVSDIYSTNRENKHLEMLDLGFTPELTSQDVPNNINRSCIDDSQKLLGNLPIQRYPKSEPLIIPFSNINNTHMPISINKTNMQYGKFKDNGPDVNSAQLIMNAVLPSENGLLHLPLPSSLSEQCLNSASSPAMIANSQSQSHPVDVVCDKLPQINLTHLDSLLRNEATLSGIQLLRHDFPNVRLNEDGCNIHSNRTCLDNYNNPNSNIISCDTSNILVPNVSSLSQSQDVSVQVSVNILPEHKLQDNHSNCYSCNEVPLESPIEVVQCFKCKFCDFVSIHKCAVASHINVMHSKMSDNASINKSLPNNIRSDNLNSSSVGGQSETHTVLNYQHIPVKNISSEKGVNLFINGTSVILKKDPAKIAKQKQCPKKVNEILKNDQSKKALNESFNATNKKNISSHKTAWKKKIRRELGSYICEFKGCNVRFRALDNLEYHRKCHTSGKSTFQCPECQMNFDSWVAIAGHLWRNHKNDMELHACDQCPFRTYSLSRLENIHKRIHQDECLFLCDTCGKSFKNGKQLRNHRDIHMPSKKSDRAFKCDICSNIFKRKSILFKHQNIVHNKVKPFMCNFCDYTASKKNSMELHMRQHTGEKPFKCDICDYRTSDHNSLRRHKMTHSGEKPYKCPYCSYSCIQACRFKVHLKTHPEGNNVMFSCNLCSFKSIKRDNYLNHIAEHFTKTRSPNETTMVDMQSDGLFPLAEAMMDINLSQSVNILSDLNKN